MFKIVKFVDESAASPSDDSDKENETEAENRDTENDKPETPTQASENAKELNDNNDNDNKNEGQLKVHISKETDKKSNSQISVAEISKEVDSNEVSKEKELSIEADHEDYEVEAIVGYKFCKRRREGLYLVKWVGWEPESNTWEPLSHVEHCTEHLHSFYKSRLDARSGATPAQKRRLELPPRPAGYEEMELREEEEPEEEYEVEQIIDYQYCRDRQAGLYLVKWVGWDTESNTWEPETNLGCSDLLTEFFKARQKERETLSPAEKRAKPLPADPRETFQKRQDFLRENVPTPTKKQLERIFQADQEKPAAKRAKMLPEKSLNEAVDQCIKSDRPNLQKINWIRDQLNIRQMVLARRKQLADLKEYEREINEIDPHAHVNVINDVDLEGPPRQMKYINAYRATEGISIPDDPPLGCSCQTCDLRNKSCCPKTSGDFEFPYTKHGKLREVIAVSYFVRNLKVISKK